jgi:hypothetical protein
MFCVAHSLSAILEKKNTCPNETAICKITRNLCDDMGKRFTNSLSKGEFTAWCKEVISSLPNVGMDTAYDSVFLGEVRLAEDSALKKSLLPPQSGVFEIFAIELSGLQSTSKRITIIL